MHAGKPWRTVEHIAEQAGPKGGRAWRLTLDCGHHAFRSIPPIRADQAATILVPIVLMHGRKPRRILVTAPHRVRCYFCVADEVPVADVSVVRPSERKARAAVLAYLRKHDPDTAGRLDRGGLSLAMFHDGDLSTAPREKVGWAWVVVDMDGEELTTTSYVRNDLSIEVY